MPIRIRSLGSQETDLQRALGELTVDAYRPLVPLDEDGYDRELADVAGRVAVATVFVALGPNPLAVGEAGGGSAAELLLGGVTHVPDAASPLAEFDDPEAAGVRMLAVAPAARGRGVGRALVEACVERARHDGRARVVLHTTATMLDAHRLYPRLGFVRDQALDVWVPLREPLQLMAYRLELDP